MKNTRTQELKAEGHELIESLAISGIPMWKTYNSLSRHMGYKHATFEFGFHFRKTDDVKQLEKAVKWLRAANKSKSLSPLVRDNSVKMLKQTKMKEALSNLKKPAKLPWYKRLFT